MTLTHGIESVADETDEMGTTAHFMTTARLKMRLESMI